MGAWIGAVLLAVGLDRPESSLPIVMRGTARASFALFAASFAARALRIIWPARSIRWASENRGHLFVAFAVSHLFHAAAILSLGVITEGRSLGSRVDLTHLLGVLTYLAIAVIALGYLKRGGADPDRRPWRELQIAGYYAIWIAFTLAYAGKSLSSPGAIPAAILSASIPLLRWSAERDVYLSAGE